MDILKTLTLPAMLPPILHRMFPRRSAPLLQLQRFRGSATGWQPIGRSRTIRDAKRLQHYLARISPEATLKLIPVNA